MSFRITVELALVDAKPPLRALADVLMVFADCELTIRRCAVFEKAGQPAWTSLPRLAVEKNGSKQFLPLIEIKGDAKKRVLEAILDEYRRKTNAC